MSQPNPNTHTHTIHLFNPHRSPARTDVITLPSSSPTIDDLQHATASLYSSLLSFTFQYRDDEGDWVRMDTTAELLEVLKEKAEAGEVLQLMLGQAYEDGAAVASDADSDDSDSFVRVEAADYMSPSSAASPHNDKPVVPQSSQPAHAVSEEEAQTPPTAPSSAESTEAGAAAPSQPSTPPAATVTVTAQPAQPAMELLAHPAAPTQPAVVPGAQEEAAQKKSRQREAEDGGDSEAESFNNLLRTANPFVVFSSAKREEVRAARPSLSARQVTTELAALWAELPPAEREVYELAAKRLRLDARREADLHPGGGAAFDADLMQAREIAARKGARLALKARIRQRNALRDAEQDEKQPQPEPVQPAAAPAPPSTAAPHAPAVVRPRKAAQAPAFARPLVANVNRKLGEVKRVVNRVGHRWLSDAQRVATPRLIQLWAALSAAVRTVKGVASTRPSVLVIGLVVVLSLLGMKAAVGRRGVGGSVQRWVPDPAVQRLEARIKTIESYGQKLLADHTDTTDTIFTLGTQLSQSTRRIDTIDAALDAMEPVVQAMSAKLQLQQITINAFQAHLEAYARNMQQLRADVDKLTAEQTTQQWSHTKAHKGRSWQDDDEWPPLPQKVAESVKKRDSRSSELASLYDDTIDELILASVFGSSPQEELQPFNSQQSSEQYKSETRRSTTAKSSPSSAVWGEPSRFATSAAWSSPSSAHSHASAGSTYASSSSASSAPSSLFESERKSARAERAERRERRKQEKEKVDSVWTFPGLEDKAQHKPAAATAPPPPPPASTSSSTHSSSCSRSSARNDNNKPSHHKKSDWWSSSSSSSQQSKKERGLKDVSKKIGKAAQKMTKALQTVNDAAKRVWKTWKSQW